jgi:hypothetical protein
VAEYLSQEWLDQQHGLVVDGSDGDGVTARVQHLVTGGPDGDVTYHVVLDGGRVVDAGPGDDPDAEVSFTSPHDVAVALLTGELDASVAFMQGRLKAAGSTAKLHRLLAQTQTQAGQAALARLRSMTDL